jgi:hypothetical protein
MKSKNLLRKVGLMSFVLLYNTERLIPYQQILNVTTCSNLKFRFFTGEPEELIGFLKDEKE